MAETLTAPVEGTTILTEPIKEAVKAETKIFPETPTGEEKPKTETKPDAETPKTEIKTEEKPAEKTSTETKPPTEEKKPEAEKATEKPQTDYDLKLPEGSPLSAEDLAQTVKDAKAAGLLKEQAQTLLNSKDQGARALKTRQDAAYEQTKVKWKEDVKNDPEMGGPKLAETVGLASRAFKTLASAELQVWAEKTGLGSYPEFVRLMAKVGRMMGEDTLIRGTVGAPQEKKPPEEVLYGATTPNGK